MITIQPCNLPCPLTNGRHPKAAIFGIETPENLYAQRYIPQHDPRYLALLVKDGVLIGVEYDDGTPEPDKEVAVGPVMQPLSVPEEAKLHPAAMNRNQLIAALKAKGLKANGTLVELQNRLKAAL